MKLFTDYRLCALHPRTAITANQSAKRPFPKRDQSGFSRVLRTKHRLSANRRRLGRTPFNPSNVTCVRQRTNRNMVVMRAMCAARVALVRGIRTSTYRTEEFPNNILVLCTNESPSAHVPYTYIKHYVPTSMCPV